MNNELNVQGEGTVLIGQRCSIAPSVQIIFAQPGTVEIGDYCVLAPGVKIVVSGGNVRIGDWTTLHDNCLLLSTVGLTIGQHGWFGQNSVLDGSGGLTIGNGVRVGMMSQLWSHVAAGEQIEGCTLYGMRPVVLEDDVWLVGSCICASGVTIGRRTVALIGSNITKSWGPELVLAGSPATEKNGLSFYQPVTLDQKWEMLLGWLGQAGDSMGYALTVAADGDSVLMEDTAGQRLCFARTSAQARALAMESAASGTTICDVEGKTYTKQLTDIEHRVLKYLAGNKARFLSA